MEPRSLVLSATVLASLVAAAPASAHGGGHDPAPVPIACSPNASLLSYNDTLSKTTFAGTDVGGLSALALTGGDRARALVDNQGTTPARVYDLKLDDRRNSAKVTGVTFLKKVA